MERIRENIEKYPNVNMLNIYLKYGYDKIKNDIAPEEFPITVFKSSTNQWYPFFKDIIDKKDCKLIIMREDQLEKKRILYSTNVILP
jgi:hypothetical protein